MTERERALQEENAQLRQKLELLEKKVDLLVRRLYGSSSEKIDPGQLDLSLGDQELGKALASPADPNGLVEAIPQPKSQTNPGDRSRKPRIPENLPVIEEVIDPEPVKACPEAWRLIGEEVSEQLDYEPGYFVRRRLIRRKYVRRAAPEEAPIIAPLPPKLIERGVAAPGLLAHIVISKYSDHLPLYRQEQIYSQRHEVQIPRQTMVGWVELTAEWLKPIYQAIKEEMFSGTYIQVDETPVRYLLPGNGKAKQGYFWTYHVPGGDTIYDWQTGRGTRCLQETVPKSFKGTLQCDAYAAYRSFAEQRPGIKLAGCMAHARRRFHEALEGCPREAGGILSQFQQLYQIEAQLRDDGASPAHRQDRRQSESRPILDRIYEDLSRFKINRTFLPQSLMGKAIDYALEQWPLLTVYLDDGAVEIDNNRAENAIRPTAVGKKNWLHIGHEDAGWRSAVIYSVIESCKGRGVEPYGYLREVLTRLPSMTNRKRLIQTALTHAAADFSWASFQARGSNSWMRLAG